jgi:hypothetical protein
MDLATEADVKKRLGGRDLTTEELARFPGLLEEAGALVEGFLNTTFVDPDNLPPPYVATVVSRVIARAFAAPSDGSVPIDGTAQQSLTAGRYMMARTFADGVSVGNVWLSKTDKIILRGPAVVSIPLASERTA